MTKQEVYESLQTNLVPAHCYLSQEQKDVLDFERPRGNVLLLIDDEVWTTKTVKPFMPSSVYRLADGVTPPEEWEDVEAKIKHLGYWTIRWNRNDYSLANTMAHPDFIEFMREVEHVDTGEKTRISIGYDFQLACKLLHMGMKVWARMRK